MLRHSATAAAQTGSTWPYTQPTWVFSSKTTSTGSWREPALRARRRSACTFAMRTAAGDKNVWVVGEGDLAGQFCDAGFLDEIIVQVGAVTLGRGKSLFPRRLTSLPRRLVSVKQIGSGFAEMRYIVPSVLKPLPREFTPQRRTAPSRSGLPWQAWITSCFACAATCPRRQALVGCPAGINWTPPHHQRLSP